jgi:hypothetical protein
VDIDIDRKGGAIGFVDDYNAWVTGASIEENMAAIQHRILPRVEAWAKESGAVFEADKTGLIHFTAAARSNHIPTEALPLCFQGKEIYPKDNLKILGVTLDTILSMDTHISKVSVRVLAKCIALQSVKGIRLKQMRQLYKACVVPTMDYATSAWFGPGKWGTERHLNRLDQVQRLGARIILRAFRQVSLEVLEAEACLETTTHRLTSRTAKHAGKLLAADQSNPAREALAM